MPTLTQLPSGHWRAQVRRRGMYRAATFPKKTDAKKWAEAVEAQAHQVAVSGYASAPRDATLADLIDKYQEIVATRGKTKAATMKMLRARLGRVKLNSINAGTLRDFIDKRVEEGAGGVTVAADLSYLSAVMKWGRHARQLDLPDHLPSQARASLKHRGLTTRSRERDREPTDDELKRLYALWASSPRQQIDMKTVCRFALATGMRLGEICALEIEDIDRTNKTALIKDRKDPRNKDGNDQVVPLLPEAWKIAEKLLKGRTTGSLFGVRAASVSTAFTRACQAAEPAIDNLRFHDLRHRATAEFFRMGLDIPRVALLTGHKTWAMLRRYTDIKPADVHAVLARPSK